MPAPTSSETTQWKDLMGRPRQPTFEEMEAQAEAQVPDTPYYIDADYGESEMVRGKVSRPSPVEIEAGAIWD